MTEQQKERYGRHLILKGIGEDGQQKLLKARVLVVGAGALGAPVLQYLVAAGVGHIGIVDADVVALSNLQRQILFREDDVGISKVAIAKETLSKLNADVVFELFTEMLNFQNAEKIISNYDIIVGATDNFESRILIDNITQLQQKPFVHASVNEFEGQVAVFNYQGSISYQDLFGSQVPEAFSSKGIFGVLPGIIGTLQAAEVLKIICNIGEVLANKLLIYDALKCEMQVVKMA